MKNLVCQDVKKRFVVYFRKKKRDTKKKRKELEKEEKRKAKLARSAANEYNTRDLDTIGEKKIRDAIR